MKFALRLSLVSLLMLTFAMLNAQSSYTFTFDNSATEPQPWTWTEDDDLTNTTLIVGSAGVGSNTWQGPYTLPFPFEFYGNAVTDVWVAENGLVTFSNPTGPVPTVTNGALPSADLPDNTIAAVWSCPETGTSSGNGGMYYGTYGTAPNRYFVIIWHSWTYGCLNDGNDFQYTRVILEEGTNNVYVVDAWTDVGNPIDNATIGVQLNSSTAVMATDSHDPDKTNSSTPAGNSLDDQNMWTFTPFVPVPNDFDLVSLDAPVDGGCGDSSQVVVFNAINSGLDPASNIDFELTVSGAATGTYTTTVPGPVPPGSVVQVQFGPIDMYDGGTFNLDAEITWAADQNPANNTLNTSVTLDDDRPGPLPAFDRDTTICDSLPVILQGFPDGNPGVELVWYEAPTGGEPDGIGNFYVTPTLTQTDTFYVAQRSVTVVSGGPQTPGSGSNNALTSNGITFDVNQSVSLDSVLIFVEDDGTFTLTLNDPSGNQLFTSTQTFNNTGQFFVPVGADLTPGTNYTIDLSGSVDLFELSTVSLLPIDVAGFIEITSNSSSGSTDGLVLFDWHLSKTSCPTALQPYIVNVEIPNLELGPDTTICAPYLLNAFDPNAVSYAWSNGETGPAVSITSTEQPLSVTVTTTNGCTATDVVNITAPGVPTFPAEDTIAVCGFWQPAPGNLDPTQQFTWSNGSTSANPTISTTGDISVIVTNGCGATLTDEWFIEVEPGPVFDLGSPDTAICNSNVLQLSTGLSGSPNFLHTWSSSAGNNPGSGPSITAAAPNANSTQADTVTYTVNVSEPGGCVATDSITAVYLGTPVVDLGDPIQSSCEFLTFDAGNANSGASYLWNTGATTQTITPQVGGSYGVTVSSAFGCEATDTVFFSKQNPFSLGLGPDTSICAPIYELTTGLSPNTYTFNWSTGQSLSSIFIGSSGTYGLTATNTNTGCQVYDEVNIVINNVPDVDLGADQPLCGQSLTLSTGINQGTQVWSTGENGPSITVTTPGTYFVNVTYNCGYNAQDTIEVLANTVPTLDITPAQTVACNPLTLETGLAGVDHLWSNGEITPSITVDESGVYSVQVTTPAGCTYGDTTNVVVGEEPVVSLQIPDTFVVNSDFAVNYNAEPNPQNATWSFGSDALPFPNASGVGQKVISYSTTGVKTVTLTVSNGPCSTTVTGEVVIVDGTSSRKPISDVSQLVEQVSVYPNPAETYFQIIYNGPLREDLNLDVYDVVGQHIEKHTMTVNPGQVYPIDIKDYAEGVYMLRITVGGQSRYMRMIKE